MSSLQFLEFKMNSMEDWIGVERRKEKGNKLPHKKL